MILIAYDGTAIADHAIGVAASLVHDGRAHLVHVWQPLSTARDGISFVGGTTIALAGAGPGLNEEIAQEAARARDVVDAGLDVARAAGFEADGEAIRGDGPPALVLEAEADRLQPELVVIGSRGLTGLSALLKGSVSHHLAAHSHAPVLIVPSAPAAQD
jgi:nucleotide-binding universal stress UspA family protein